MGNDVVLNFHYKDKNNQTILQNILFCVLKKKAVTLYFKVSLLQCNYTFKYKVILFNCMYLLYG